MVAVDNKERALRIYEILNQKTLDQLDNLVATDLQHHIPGLPAGLPLYKGLLASYHAGFPDIHHSIEEIVAEDDQVAVLIHSTGTHTGTFMSHPPTGKRFTVTGMELLRFAGSKLAERRGIFDTITMLQQLGLYIPAPAGSDKS